MNTNSQILEMAYGRCLEWIAGVTNSKPKGFDLMNIAVIVIFCVQFIHICAILHA